MGIDFAFLTMYNLAKEEKLIYFTTFLNICQERNFIMDPEPSTMKELITVALAECTDIDMLDLIYKLLTYNNIEGRAD